jgi:hypothetical protein
MTIARGEESGKVMDGEREEGDLDWSEKQCGAY